MQFLQPTVISRLNMLPEFITLVLAVISVVSCQIDGEFWWLNNDITKLSHGKAPSPNFDDVNELDTDETAKVIFKDNEEKKGKSLLNSKDITSTIHFRDETKLAKPGFEFNQLNLSNKLWERPLKQSDIKKNTSLQNNEDELQFIFPSDDNLMWIDRENAIKNKKPLATENISESSNKVTSIPKILPQSGISPDVKNPLLPESICTFLKKAECIRNEGTLYEPWMMSNIKMTLPNTQVICCILPIRTTPIPKIIFPDKYWGTKRQKRSNVDETPELKQRNTLMSRKYAQHNQKVGATTPTTRKKANQKIVNSDEYPVDPYWNIKNSNIRNPDTLSYQDPDTSSDYGSQSYGDDYTVELPKPGLIGLYSDHKQTQSIRTHNKYKDFYYDPVDSVEEEEFETDFGYSTIDPRKDHRVTSMSSKYVRPRPSKLSTATSRIPVANLQNPTIYFHSNPDFQVLQGFKLLNLMRSNKNRFVRTTDNNKECGDNGDEMQVKPPNLNYLENNYDDNLIEANLKQKLFNECGKPQRGHGDIETGLRQGVVELGGHPWIALVVLTKSDYNILCYATLVHARVAVSIADCVNGKLPGAVSIIAGLRNLDKDLAQAQRRMVTITLDSEFTPGNLKHNLALLHWLRPLIFDARIQPACLGPYKVMTRSNCVFVGWGGYDQEMQSDLRWQEASILAPQNCTKRLSELEVSDVLCAAVESRRTVTGVGEPLLCKSNERWSAVGVAVRRNEFVLALPLGEWVMRNMVSLPIQ